MVESQNCGKTSDGLLGKTQNLKDRIAEWRKILDFPEDGMTEMNHLNS